MIPLKVFGDFDKKARAAGLRVSEWNWSESDQDPHELRVIFYYTEDISERQPASRWQAQRSTGIAVATLVRGTAGHLYPIREP